MNESDRWDMLEDAFGTLLLEDLTTEQREDDDILDEICTFAHKLTAEHIENFSGSTRMGALGFAARRIAILNGGL